jgi:MerR family transcriptional regulator, repressor of the yfmOP operon
LYLKYITNDLKRRGDLFHIGDVSKKVNLSQKTIRDYEKMGLIKPGREPSTNNRIYTNFDIAQIKHITHLIHHEGFTLPCLQRIFQLAPCWNIFACKEKDRCPAYQFAQTPCYETRKVKGTLCGGACEQCAVYINRLEKRKKVMNGPIRRQKPSFSRP